MPVQVDRTAPALLKSAVLQ